MNNQSCVGEILYVYWTSVCRGLAISPGLAALVVQCLRGAGKGKRKHSNDLKCQSASFPDDSSEAMQTELLENNHTFLLKSTTILEGGKATDVCVGKGWRVVWGAEAGVHPTPALMKQQSTWGGSWQDSSSLRSLADL